MLEPNSIAADKKDKTPHLKALISQGYLKGGINEFLHMVVTIRVKFSQLLDNNNFFVFHRCKILCKVLDSVLLFT